MRLSTRLTNGCHLGVLLRIIVALLLLLDIPLAAAQWEPATEFTSVPLHKGKPMKMELRYTFSLGFDPGQPRKFRYKGEGLFARFGEDEVTSVAKRLLVRMGGWESARLNGADARRAIYFANKRFFLVSVEPAVLAMVPHPFIPADFVYSIGNLQNLNWQGRYNSIFEAERKRGLHSLPSKWDEPDSFWLNYLELGSVVPDTAGIDVVSELWNAPVSLEAAMADARWPFRAIPSERFPGYLEFTGR